jgi:AcrR family transcriptional regulator
VTTAPVADGRSARSAKTRDAIADALLDLLVDGNLRPTAKEIAERAGVSVRSVYVHFDDLEDLFCVAAKRHFARVAPMLEPPPATGSLTERARAFVEHRVRLYAKLGAVARATQLQAPFSPTLARIVRDAHGRSSAELERVFATELDAMPADTRGQTVAVLDALTNPRSWEIVRELHDVPVDDGIAALASSIIALLEARS